MGKAVIPIEYINRYPTMHEYAEGKRINPKLTDLISRADAVNAVHKYFVDKINNEPHKIDEDGDDVFTDMKSVNALFHHNKMVSKAIKALPSADAEPTVIRSRTLMPTKDFKEWAKRIREENPNAVVIPCDAEVVSADAVQGWRIGKPTEQGKYMVTIDSFGHKRIDLFYYGKPLMSNRKVRGKCWYRSDDEWGDVVYDDTDILAWMPLPKPYREESEVEE